MPAIASAKQLMLGKHLRALRIAADLEQSDVARSVGRTAGLVSHWELGRSRIDKAMLFLLANQVYSADDETYRYLEHLRSTAKTRGWWSSLPSQLGAYIGLEAEADQLRCFRTEGIPGIMQTRSYAAAVNRIAGQLTDEEVAKYVEIRMRRQSRLADAEKPLRADVILSEASLRRCSVHPSCDQLRGLIERAELPTVTLRVVPFSAGLHASMSGSFTMLSFPNGLLHDVGYHEYPIGHHLIEDEESVRQLRERWELLEAQALSPPESIDLIEYIQNRGK